MIRNFTTKLCTEVEKILRRKSNFDHMLSFYWMPEIIKDIKEKSIEMLSDE